MVVEGVVVVAVGVVVCEATLCTCAASAGGGVALDTSDKAGGAAGASRGEWAQPIIEVSEGAVVVVAAP